MLVRHIDQIIGTEREVDVGDWVSRRLVLRGDGMNHSLHETIFRASQERRMQYRNHQESVYCIGGEGEIECVETGEIHPIGPGTVYVLNRHDDHILRAKTDLRLICVFSPALVGPETHDEYRSYPLLDDDGTVIRQ